MRTKYLFELAQITVNGFHLANVTVGRGGGGGGGSKTLKIHFLDTFCKSNQFVKVQAVAMATKLQKVPHRFGSKEK